MKNKADLKRKDVLKKLNSFHGNIYSSDEFKTLVKYERTRSDRYGNEFSIVVFSSEQEIQFNSESVLLKLSKLTRSIDCLGWNESGQISVLLPDTKSSGAEFFGKKVVDDFRDLKKIPLTFEIYTYPENWIDKENDLPPDQKRRESVSDTMKSSVEQLFVKRMPGWKRALDITGASAILLLTLPISLFLCVFIKLVSPGPIFFKQIRIGYKGIPFTFWKFRTMAFQNNQGFHGAYSQNFIKDGEIPMEKLDTKDPRIILGGKIIRKSCIDELPQLWNVLRGEMSLVGPRPCIPYEAKEYLRWHTHRFDTVPGLSGLWQVSGKNKLTFNQMIRLDIKYCRKMSLLGDILIILRTPVAILAMVCESMTGKFKEARKMATKTEHPLQNTNIYNDLAKAVPDLER